MNLTEINKKKLGSWVCILCEKDFQQKDFYLASPNDFFRGCIKHRPYLNYKRNNFFRVPRKKKNNAYLNEIARINRYYRKLNKYTLSQL